MKQKVIKLFFVNQLSCTCIISNSLENPNLFDFSFNLPFIIRVARSSCLSIHCHSTRNHSIVSCIRSSFVLAFVYFSSCLWFIISHFTFSRCLCFLTKELNYNDLYNQRLRYAFLFLLKNYGIIMILTRTQ